MWDIQDISGHCDYADLKVSALHLRLDPPTR